MKTLVFFTLLLLMGCASEPQHCINFSARRAKYVRQYVADDISVHEFIIFNNELDLLAEMGAEDCEGK